MLETVGSLLYTILLKYPLRWRWWIFIAVIVGGSFASLAIRDIKIGSFERGSDDVLGLSLGLDLAGGIHLVYEPKDKDFEPTQGQMDGLIANITRRVDRLGVAEPSIQQLDKDRVVIQLPGIDDVERAEQLIGQTAQLDIVERICTANPCGEENPGSYNDQPTDLTGADMSRAFAGTDQATNEPVLLFKLNSDATRRFFEITQRLFDSRATQPVPNELAFVLDGEVLISAAVSSPILAGNGQVSGGSPGFTTTEVRDLAIQIESGRLPIEIEKISSTVVSPSLGADSLEQAIEAGLIGLGLVLLFMVAYYRMAGLVAAVSLILYSTMVLAVFKLFPVTLTLAGLAGFVITLGMAVDANILIFERMKEEIRIGRTLPFAVQIGFNRAWASIRDGNVSTLIIGAILFFFGSGSANSAVTGFAVSLTVGVLISMFTAIVISRRLIALLVSTGLRRYPRMFSPEGRHQTTTEQGT